MHHESISSRCRPQASQIEDAERLEYICDMAEQLNLMARSARFSQLAYFLEMAAGQARSDLDRISPGRRTKFSDVGRTTIPDETELMAVVLFSLGVSALIEDTSFVLNSSLHLMDQLRAVLDRHAAEDAGVSKYDDLVEAAVETIVAHFGLDHGSKCRQRLWSKIRRARIVLQ